MDLNLHYWLSNVHNTLGPGNRAVIWVQGCSLHCQGCILPEAWDKGCGDIVDVCKLAMQVLLDPGIEGITVSGGEPVEQPEAVAELLSYMKNAGKNTWVYTGYTIEELVERNDPVIDKLLSLTDVLVDGRFNQSEAGTYLFRGSLNQRIIRLTDAIPKEALKVSNTSRLEINLDVSGSMAIAGVPPPGFFRQFARIIENRGVHVKNTKLWE
ncbi:MAG: radical SAM protein [Nitrospirae bacterium]|nr:radical SAM protein [Nitrospirota bacterium]